MLSDQISLLESAKQDKKVNESYLRALKTMDEKLVFDEVKKIHSAVLPKQIVCNVPIVVKQHLRY